MPIVKVFSAGDHWHAEPEEAGELVQLALERSGYTKELEWECRIDKMRKSDTNARPLRVITYKPFGVVLRVKPKTNGNYDQQMTLLIPEGSQYSAKNLFDQLKGIEKSISRQWRQQVREQNKQPGGQEVEHIQMPLMPPIEQEIVSVEAPIEELVVEEPEEKRPDFRTLKGICKNTEKLKYVLVRIHKINQLDVFHTKGDFTQALMNECGWDKEGHLPRICGRVVSEFVKFGYVGEIVNERGKIIGYNLTKEGLALIDGVEIPLKPKAKSQEEPTALDFVNLLAQNKEKTQELADVANRLATNHLKKEELKREVRKLDEEDVTLMKVISQNRETFVLLNKLVKEILPLPTTG